MSNDFYHPTITKDILAYSNLLYMTEYRGKERANGLLIIGQSNPDSLVLKHFAQNIAVAKEHEELFLQYADTKTVYSYKKLLHSSEILQIETIEAEIFQHNHTHYADQKAWFEIMSKIINRLDEMGNQIQTDLKASIVKLYNQSQKRFNLVLFLSFLTLLVVAGAVYIFTAMVKEEKRKHLISQKYIISSMTDLKGNIIDVSQAFCDISGYTREELIGKPHNIVRHPETPREVFKELWSNLKKGKSWSGKVKNRTKDGGFYWVYANVEPFYDASGNITSYISTRIDITKQELLSQKFDKERRKRIETEAMMAQQSRLAQMGEMLSMIAHQWRQPLAAISSTSSTIYFKSQQPECDREQIASLAKKIIEFTQHLTATIEDFRNFFKPDKTKMLTDFQKITQRVINIIESSLTNRNINLQVEIEEIVSFESFENELMQVVLNLLKNAEDALIDNNVKDPRIMIRINGRTIQVCDNAGGIDKSIIDKIYDPYFSTKMQKDGTGLGLYMSKMIIERNCEGKLYHENKNGGACFTVTIF
ncbi:Methyl-accepting chemotaxis protein [hydrothermal vent metagenome]|uniref:Methyl-accepting chemotaxis protein n=1 Tax=hydrothermal vent metagenome TaxID=652676 RepID=A0A1W1E7H3_9ZZZZ